MKASRIITRVRRFLDQVPITNENVGTDSAVLGSPSTIFSDADLLQRINNAQRAIVSKVKAQHVPFAIKRYTGPFPSIQEDVIRLLHSRVFYTGVVNTGVFHTYDTASFFEGIPTPNQTLYTFLAGRRVRFFGLLVTTGWHPSGQQSLVVYHNTNIIGTVTLNPNGVHTVSIPPQINLVPGDYVRIQASGTIDAGNIYMAFSGEAEVIFTDTTFGVRAVQRTVERHRRLEQAGRQATGLYPVYTYEDEALNIYPDSDHAECYLVVAPPSILMHQLAAGTDDLTVDERFEAAMMMHVAASCYQTMRHPMLQGWAMNTFEDEIDAYALYNRLSGVFDDRECDVE